MSPVDLHGGLVDLAQHHRPEVQRPDAIGALLEPHVMFFQGVREEEQFVLEANGAGDALHLEVPRVFEWRQHGGKRTRRGGMARRRGVALQGRMGSLFIVLAAKRVEGALLPRQIQRRGPRGLRFQGALGLRTWIARGETALRAPTRKPGGGTR